MYDLIRFFEKKEYMEEFLDGNLFMNSLSHFWKLEEAPQKDVAEGVIETLHKDDFKKQHGSFISDFFGDEHIVLPIMNRSESYKYCHLLCCMLHEYDSLRHEAVRIDSRMKSMGKYTVRIYNVEEFVNRLYDKLKSKDLYGLMGPVNYHSAYEESQYRDCFDKNDGHAYEQEWRFAVIPDYKKAQEMAQKDINAPYDAYIRYDIGSIRDIAEQVDTEQLVTDAGSVYKSNKGTRYRTVEQLSNKKQAEEYLQRLRDNNVAVPYDVDPVQYVGWAPREAFRQKVMEIDGGFMKPLAVIG